MKNWVWCSWNKLWLIKKGFGAHWKLISCRSISIYKNVLCGKKCLLQFRPFNDARILFLQKRPNSLEFQCSSIHSIWYIMSIDQSCIMRNMCQFRSVWKIVFTLARRNHLPKILFFLKYVMRIRLYCDGHCAYFWHLSPWRVLKIRASEEEFNLNSFTEWVYSLELLALQNTNTQFEIVDWSNTRSGLQWNLNKTLN